MIETYTKDTLTREVLEQGVKLRVTDVHHSTAFQRACFDLKVFWEHGKGEQHTSEPYLFVEVYRGELFLRYDDTLDIFDSQPETEIHFDDGRASTVRYMQHHKAYIVNFSRQGCIEPVIWYAPNCFPDSLPNTWSREVVAVTNLRRVFSLSCMGTYWQRPRDFAEGEYVVAWADFPDIEQQSGGQGD